MKRGIAVFVALAAVTACSAAAIAQPAGPVDDTRDVARQADPAGLKRAEIVRQHPDAATISPVPATQPGVPATQPADPAVQKLIEQLGDDDAHVRDAAVKALRKMGKDALPALREAMKSSDPQVKTSAEVLVAEMTSKPNTPQFAALPPDDFPLQGGIIVRGGGIVMNNVRLGNVAGQMQVQMQVAHGVAVRDVKVNENGRKVHIHEDGEGVKVEVTDNGQTKEYKAANAAELKEKQPEGYKEYDRFLNDGVGRVIRVAPPAPR